LPPFEGREVLLVATYAIVVVSVLVQGLTVGKLIEWLIPEEERAGGVEPH
jgi:NhaP-type Na+/H+ or K+/H+ antiporter